MNPPPLADRLQRLVEGCVTPEERLALEEILIGDESARLLYLDIVDVHNLLEQRGEHPAAPGEVVPMDRIVARQKRRSARIAAFGAAAAIAAAGIVSIFTVLPDAPTARFQVAPQTQFTLTHATPAGETPPEGNVFEVGSRLQLAHGTLQLRFASGVEGIVRAPADLTLRERDLVALRHGNVWFQVPENARGFKVDTPEFLLTDLGTEFGIVSRPESPDLVHVMQGAVEIVNHRGDGHDLTLTAYQSRRALPDGGWEEIAFSSDAFLTELPSTPALPSHLYWSFDQLQGGGLPVTGTHLSAGQLPPTPISRESGTSLVEGRVGKALAIGSREREIVTAWEGVAGGKARTVAFWIKVPRGGFRDAQVVGWGNWNSNRINGQWSFRVTNNTYSADNTATPTDASRVMLVLGHCWLTTTKDIDDGQWHHIAASYRGGSGPSGRPEVSFYIDGIPEPLSYHEWTASPVPVNTLTGGPGDSPVVLGAPPRGAPEAFSGQIDELYIFPSALSETEIYALTHPKDPATH